MRRKRRPLPGILLHLNESHHRWFQDESWYALIGALDDSTRETYYAQLVEAESTRTVIAALKEVIKRRGRSCTLYSDRARHYFQMLEAANRFLRERYIPEMNGKLGVQAEQPGHDFVPLHGQDLDRIFSIETERVVWKDNTVQIGDRRW